MGSKDIVFESTYENIKEFIKGKDLMELTNLYLYIMGSESMERPPSPLEREFIKEFFSDDAWADFIQYRKREKGGRKSFFKHIPPFDLHTISGILSFEIMKELEGEFKGLDNLKKTVTKLRTAKKELKTELKVAIDNSYEDGIFYKADGWCNVADVLERHKLIKLEEE